MLNCCADALSKACAWLGREGVTSFCSVVTECMKTVLFGRESSHPHAMADLVVTWSMNTEGR